jgi:hypothetical protein
MFWFENANFTKALFVQVCNCVETTPFSFVKQITLFYFPIYRFFRFDSLSRGFVQNFFVTESKVQILFKPLIIISRMFYRFNWEQKPVFLSFENCSEVMVQILLMELRPFLLDFCLKHKCFYCLYTKPAVNNQYSFGLDFYFGAPEKSHDDLFIDIKNTFANRFSQRKATYGSVKFFRYIPVRAGFSKVFQSVMAFNHLHVEVETRDIAPVDFCFSLMEKFDLNCLVFLPKRKIFVRNRVAYCMERDKRLVLLIQNDENFDQGVKVLDFIERQTPVTVLFSKQVAGNF